MDADDELTTIATFSNTAEAELARERLEQEGFRAFVVGAVTAHVVPNVVEGPSIALEVGTEDAAQAREILGIPEPRAHDGRPAIARVQPKNADGARKIRYETGVRAREGTDPSGAHCRRLARK